ncbi:hypothetical protein DFH07DRAFT_848650, partial [Mycena maculata]
DRNSSRLISAPYSLYLFKSVSQLAPTFTPDEFLWESIVPGKELVWHDDQILGAPNQVHYSHFLCGQIPLDYSNPDAASAAISMTRIHSIVPHNSSEYRGSILINPGGPGGSGVDMVQIWGANISTIVGPEFDVIGFDPRGISRSIPRVSFFESRSQREVWLKSPDNLHALSMNAPTDTLPRAWAQGIIERQLAGERDDGNLRFINTAHTARDMLRIVQAHGREKLQYWGFSCVVVKPAQFTSPLIQDPAMEDNVERLVIDGVADSENYFATEWSNNLVDTEKTWGTFVDGCVAAGPQGCAFLSPIATELEANIDKIYSSLRVSPIPVRTNTSFGVVDYSMMRSVIFRSLYSPYAKFPVLAGPSPAFKCGCDPSEFRGTAVRCNDGKRMPSSYQDVIEHYQNTSKLSRWADVWQAGRLACAHRTCPRRNWTTELLILILYSAKKMSQGFAGSVVLAQDSAGHCKKYVRGYFLNGTLPEPGIVCPVISSPLPTHDYRAPADAQVALARSAGDHKLLEAVTELAKTFDFPFLGGL